MTTIQIVRKKLSADEVGGANTRYDDDCDCTQTTPDGGTTWIDNPGIDPRHSPALQMPPRTTSDPQCDAAANMRHQLEKFINTIVTVASQGAGASQILGVLAFFMPEIAILWLLATEIVGGLLSVGQSVINAAFTTPVYDQLEQIFYCNISSDGTCSAEQLAAIESDIGSIIGGVVQVVMAAYLTLTGEVGLTNSGAVGDEVGDCSGFICGWCYEIDFTSTDGGWSSFSTPGAVYTPGVGWTDATSGGTRGTFIESPTFPLATFTHIEFDYTAVDNVTSTVDYGRVSGTITMLDVCPGALGSFTVGWDGSESFDQVGLQVGNSTSFPAGSSKITRALFRGTGANPFGDNNCL